MNSLFETLESNVRYYCRDYPVVFRSAERSFLFDTQGRRYVDFFCGAGALNYGHNPPNLKHALLEYIGRNGIIHSLDMYTEAKHTFLETFSQVILKPRRMAYKLQFTGPTGTNAVEAALKLARKVTGRSSVVAFTNAYHGVSLGALAATASSSKRAAAGVNLSQVTRLPYDGFLGGESEANYAERMLTAAGNGVDAPAAIILETVQGEGGLQTASPEWIQRIAQLARQLGALLIIDEIQTGCGRTGPFFSFEQLGVLPDIVCLSKSISGLGLPMSLVLIDPRYDVWKPGEHNGTFRGHNLAFVTGAAALNFWTDQSFLLKLKRNIEHLDTRLRFICQTLGHARVTAKGRGMLRGLAIDSAQVAANVKRSAFERGLLFETCGPEDNVLKLSPPLNIELETLDEGLTLLTQILERALSEQPRSAVGGA